MRIWFDTEFIEDGSTIDLISIGLVREDGKELYLESDAVNWRNASQWVLDHVHPHLTGHQTSRAEIAERVLEFAGESPVFWAYYADYDWVALCQLYGKMIDLPKGWPMYCRDLKQEIDTFCPDKRFPGPDDEHHALADAHWTYNVWRHVQKLKDETR